METNLKENDDRRRSTSKMASLASDRPNWPSCQITKCVDKKI